MKSLNNTIPPPLLALIFAAIMWGIAAITPNLGLTGSANLWLALGFIGSGVGVCLAGVVSFRFAKTTVNPLKPDTASTLVTAGIYQYTRNPMYLGFSLSLVGWALYLSSLWAMTGVGAYMLFIQNFQIKPEEAALQTLFGDDFKHYQQKVRRWL